MIISPAPIGTALAQIRALSPSNDDFLQRKAGAWANRPVAQVLADLMAGGQLAFPATQNASSDPNTLDDYEEGVWTPTDNSGASLSFTASGLQYVKIGQFLLASFYIQFPATGNGSLVNIAGLPFTASALSGGVAQYGAFITFTDFASFIAPLVVSSGANFNLSLLGGSFATNAQMSSKQMRGVILYRASA